MNERGFDAASRHRNRAPDHQGSRAAECLVRQAARLVEK